MLTIGQSVKMKVIARGNATEVYMNGIKIVQAHDSTFSCGYNGFRVYGWGDYPSDSTFSGVTFH